MDEVAVPLGLAREVGSACPESSAAREWLRAWFAILRPTAPSVAVGTRPRTRPLKGELADHAFEEGAEHDEVVGIGGLLHLAVGHAAGARPHRHDREPQRAEDFVPMQILG